MKTLAIIDDEQEMECLYELMLEDSIKQGLLALNFFSDARSFATWLKTNTPDLVLCDINMPYLSGVEIGRLIKGTNSAISLYFVSGYDEADYKDIMRELGVTNFLSKPLDYDFVLKSINTELGLPSNS